MSKIKYVKEPGFVYDLLFIFALYYNKDVCIKKFINRDKGREDIRFYDKILEQFPEFSEELIPFFYFNDRMSCIMTCDYFQSVMDSLFAGRGTDCLYEQIADTNRLRRALVNFYLDLNNSSDEIDNMPLPELLRQFALLSLPSEVKQWAMVMLADPQTYCTKLIEAMRGVEEQLSEYYTKQQKIINEIHEGFDVEASGELLSGALGDHSFTNTGTCISICIIHINVLRYDFAFNKTFFTIGLDWEKAALLLKNQSAAFDVALFGKIMSDASRLKVIRMLTAANELSTGVIAGELETALPSCFYHLEMMRGSGMLSSRSEGRTVFYKINRNYFTKATEEVMKLIEEDLNSNEEMDEADS